MRISWEIGIYSNTYMYGLFTYIWVIFRILGQMLANIPYMDPMGYDLTMNNGDLHLAVLKHCWKIHENTLISSGVSPWKTFFFEDFPVCLVWDIYIYIEYTEYTHIWTLHPILEGLQYQNQSTSDQKGATWVCPQNWSGKLYPSCRWDNHALISMDKLRNVDLLYN